MKTKKSLKKLKLNKTTIIQLNELEISNIKGGTGSGDTITNCEVQSCEPNGGNCD